MIFLSLGMVFGIVAKLHCLSQEAKNVISFRRKDVHLFRLVCCPNSLPVYLLYLFEEDATSVFGGSNGFSITSIIERGG